MPLSDLTIRKAQAQSAQYKLTDGGGLYLLVTSTGSKLWRFDYRHSGKRKTMALGAYPDVGLSKARDRHQDARRLLADGIDPSAERKSKAASEKAKAEYTLSKIAEEWLTKQHASSVEESTLAATRKILTKNILVELGERPIADISAQELLVTLRKLEARAPYSAHKCLSIVSRIFRYAIPSGYLLRNVADDLKGALKPSTVTHHAAITDPARLGDLLRAIYGYQGSPMTVAALKLVVMLFVRPGELRHAKWSDIDFDKASWSYLVTKTKTQHVVPLPDQAITILQGLHVLTGHRELVFSGLRAKNRPMSENTINAALRYLGFSGDDMVGHGFRATARTILDEVLEYPLHIIEQQLAHAVKDPLGRAYNRTAHLPQRRAMMQAWADYLDKLKNGDKA